MGEQISICKSRRAPWWNGWKCPEEICSLWRGEDIGAVFLAWLVSSWVSHWCRTAFWSRDPMLKQEKSVRSKEQKRQPMMNYPQFPFLTALHPLPQRGRSRRFQTEVETRKLWGVGRICVFRFVLIFLLYYSVISWQENNVPLVMSVLPVTIIAEWSHCPYLSHELFALFSLLSCWEGGELVGTSWPTKVSSPYCSALTGRQQNS